MNGHEVKAGIRVYFCRNAVQGKPSAALSALSQREDVVLEAVPCSGKVDPRYLLKAFESGAHTVCILACPTGECRLMQGNLRAAKRVQAVRELLAEAGIDPNAVQIFFADSLQQASVEAVSESIARLVEETSRPITKAVAR